MELLCTSKDSQNVYYDPVNSHAATHFADTPNLKELVIEVLKSRDIVDHVLEFDIDMGRTIGTCDVVETDGDDEIVYAYRKNRIDQGYLPFTKSRSAQANSHISIALVKNPDGTYQLSSAWIGTWDDPPFPQQANATPESKPYWNTHAFVLGSQEIEPNSVINSCPW